MEPWATGWEPPYRELGGRGAWVGHSAEAQGLRSEPQEATAVPEKGEQEGTLLLIARDEVPAT